MLELRERKQGIIIEYSNDFGWCIRGWNRSKKRGDKRKSKRFVLDNKDDIFTIVNSMKVQLSNPDDIFYTIVLEKDDVKVILHRDYMAVRCKKILYKVRLSSESRKGIISELNKIAKRIK